MKCSQAARFRHVRRKKNRSPGRRALPPLSRNSRGSRRWDFRDQPSDRGGAVLNSTGKHGYPPASWKNSRNGLAGRHRRPSRSNQRKGSRSLRGKATGIGGARHFPRRARENARIRQGLDYARRSARFSRSGLFAQEDPAGCQRRRCIAKLRIRRLVFAAVPAKSCRVYRARAAPAKQGRDRKRDPRRENRRPFAPRRRGLAPSTAFESRLRMREQRLRHGEQGGAAASRKLTLEGKLGTVFGGVPLGVAKGNRRFASQAVLPPGSIADGHRLPFIDFGHTLLFSPRDGSAKGKKAHGAARMTSLRAHCTRSGDRRSIAFCRSSGKSRRTKSSKKEVIEHFHNARKR
jgi:hypothetical protein